MEGVDPKAFEYAVGLIKDGNLFENFCQSFLSSILGYDFIPVGGIKDKGIDGLEHVFCKSGNEKRIYQFSIEKGTEGKVFKSLNKLKDNKISFDVFTYVTNQEVKNIDKLAESAIDSFSKTIRIFDVKYLSSRANFSSGTINAYRTFIESYLHEFNKPGKSYVVGDLIEDPRLFVFLRQQWDANRKSTNLDNILVDTIIMYSLKDTNPDKNIIKTEEEIIDTFTKILKYDVAPLREKIKTRLGILCKKPRAIKYHKKLGGYLLPYETRYEIQQRNIEDALLHEQFQNDLEESFKANLAGIQVSVKDCLNVVESLINQLYFKQGVEFADFILRGESQDAFEKSLPDIVGQVVDESTVIVKNKEKVKNALLITIRNLVYNGTKEQKSFLQKLSNTYMMLFLLHCDPNISTFFNTIASRLNIYVCTSIIIPAMSEYFLDPVNRRHWNLLESANKAGIKLVINKTIINELAAHFNKINAVYKDQYLSNEDLFSDELDILYIDEIMIRAYFYAKMRGQTGSFYDFIDNFISPSLSNVQNELIIWLKDTFGIQYIADESLGITIDKGEFEILVGKLEDAGKKSRHQAKTDAKLILTIFKIREKNNEQSEPSIFGYNTWWLSKDIITQREINLLFGGKYNVSCYIRPDFLYNYIALSPRYSDVDEAYKTIFPTLVGINLSYHLPKDIVDYVHSQIKEHKTKNPTRMKMILRELITSLIADPKKRDRKFITTYFDTRLKELTESK